MIEVSGAARQISDTLIEKFGRERLPWAVMCTGLLVGIPLFYNAGFVILVPLVFSIALTSKVPLLWVAIPMAASLSVTHGFLPPHPGPTAIASIFHADLGKVLIYGLIIAVPVIVIAGPLFANVVRRMKVAEIMPAPDTNSIPNMPGVKLSFSLAVFPVFLIAVATVSKVFLGINHPVIQLLAEPVFALLLAFFLAGYFLGWKRGLSMNQMMGFVQDSVSGIAMIMMIIAAGGAFKQVLIDSGVANEVAAHASRWSVSPLVLAWLIAALVRVCIGSATIAGLTAAGIVSTIAQGPGVNPELMVLSIGAGSLMFSHVNDTGFWMFKEYFNLSLKQTFLSWTAMETIVSITGLAGVLLMNHLTG
jgi:Gnt-I system high-affinity gluconate transporter